MGRIFSYLMYQIQRFGENEKFPPETLYFRLDPAKVDLNFGFINFTEQVTVSLQILVNTKSSFEDILRLKTRQFPTCAFGFSKRFQVLQNTEDKLLYFSHFAFLWVDIIKTFCSYISPPKRRKNETGAVIPRCLENDSEK